MQRDPLVAVLLGTDHHPFDRLLAWVGEVSRAGGTRWFVQHGSTRLPRGLTGVPMLGAQELADLLARADAVVTHGGPGLIMEARAQGHLPVVVPRDPALGEHVDGHQIRFAARLAQAGLVLASQERDQFVMAVDLALGTVRRDATTGGVSQELCRRFGDLVSDLVRAR